MLKNNNYPIEVEKQTDILIVGGGVSGLAAAIGAASSGCEVLILEKEAQLGGMFCKGWGFPIGGLFGMEDNAPKGTLNDGLVSEFYNHICKTQSNPLMRLGRLWVCRSLLKEAVDFFELKIKQAGHICSLTNSILHSTSFDV